jgi:hypothetical protein
MKKKIELILGKYLSGVVTTKKKSNDLIDELHSLFRKHQKRTRDIYPK